MLFRNDDIFPISVSGPTIPFNMIIEPDAQSFSFIHKFSSIEKNGIDDYYIKECG
jgi:hypothetical protein